MGRSHYDKQVDIIEFMKSFREVKAVVKALIDREGTFLLDQTLALGYVKEKEEEYEIEKTKDDQDQLSVIYT